MTDEPEPLDQWVADALREMEKSSELSSADAAAILTGGLPEQSAVTGPLPRKNRRQAFEEAQRELGDDPAEAREREKQEEKRAWLATEWRYLVLSKLGRNKERARLVALLESNLDGTEIQLPTWISQAVGRIIEFDNRQPPQPHPAASSEELYNKLADAFRAHADEDGESSSNQPNA